MLPPLPLASPTETPQAYDERKGKAQAFKITGGFTEGYTNEDAPVVPTGPVELTDEMCEGKCTGIVARWNDEKGFGFVKPDGASTTRTAPAQSPAAPPSVGEERHPALLTSLWHPPLARAHRWW